MPDDERNSADIVIEDGALWERIKHKNGKIELTYLEPDEENGHWTEDEWYENGE